MFDGHDPLWESSEPFCKRAAWVDFIQLAQWRPFRHNTMNGDIELGRGELLASQRHLAERWHWGRQQVRTFLRYLEKSARIVAQRETQDGTVYVLPTYDSYQGESAARNPEDNPPSSPGLTQVQPKNKNRKKESSTTPPAGGAAAGAKSPPTQPSWVVVCADQLAAAKGGVAAYGMVGKHLKPLKLKHGAEAVQDAWGRFVTSEKVSYGPGYFARNYSDFSASPTTPARARDADGTALSGKTLADAMREQDHELAHDGLPGHGQKNGAVNGAHRVGA